MKSVLLSFLLLGCVVRTPPPTLPMPVVTCPARPADLPPLPAVVDAPRLALAYREANAARLAERRRGDLCADSLQRMGDWAGQLHE